MNDFVWHCEWNSTNATAFISCLEGGGFGTCSCSLFWVPARGAWAVSSGSCTIADSTPTKTSSVELANGPLIAILVVVIVGGIVLIGGGVYWLCRSGWTGRLLATDDVGWAAPFTDGVPLQAPGYTYAPVYAPIDRTGQLGAEEDIPAIYSGSHGEDAVPKKPS
jgi:hypothetical protein